MIRILFPRFGGDLFEPARDGFLELESDPIAGAGNSSKRSAWRSRLLLGHGSVYDPDSLSLIAESQATDHALVVRVGERMRATGHHPPIAFERAWACLRRAGYALRVQLSETLGIFEVWVLAH